MRSLLAALLFLFVSCSLHSQNANTIAKTDSQRVFTDTLIIFYGETLYFEANIEGDKIIDFKKVDRISDVKITIEITLGESAISGKGSTLMKIRNPFEKTLTYQAEMKVSKSKKQFVKTSVVPVYSKIFSMEMWPEKLEVIRLTNFKLE